MSQRTHRDELHHLLIGSLISIGIGVFFSSVVFVSDGIPEAPLKGEPLGYERLSEILALMPGEVRGEAWLDHLLSRVRENVDDGLNDHWTAVVVER